MKRCIVCRGIADNCDEERLPLCSVHLQSRPCFYDFYDLQQTANCFVPKITQMSQSLRKFNKLLLGKSVLLLKQFKDAVSCSAKTRKHRVSCSTNGTMCQIDSVQIFISLVADVSMWPNSILGLTKTRLNLFGGFIGGPQLEYSQIV